MTKETGKSMLAMQHEIRYIDIYINSQEDMKVYGNCWHVYCLKGGNNRFHLAPRKLLTPEKLKKGNVMEKKWRRGEKKKKRGGSRRDERMVRDRSQSTPTNSPSVYMFVCVVVCVRDLIYSCMTCPDIAIRKIIFFNFLFCGCLHMYACLF